MASIQLDLSDSRNWEEVYAFSATAERVGNQAYKPIPQLTIPILFNRSILAVYAEAPNSPPYYKNAGWLSQKINLGITVGGTPDSAPEYLRRVRLKQISLIQWPQLVSEYGIIFNAHYWLEAINLRFWSYTGPETSDVSEQIDLVRIDVLRTERKINFLLERG